MPPITRRVSKQLATLIGGALDVSSTVATGSKFTLWLRLEGARAAKAEHREVEQKV